MSDFPEIPMIPFSWGEIIDKLTILEIKSQRLTDRNGERKGLSDVTTNR